MPYKFETDKFILPPEHDRRRKLTEEQYEEIRVKYATGLYSQRQLATEYKVSRRLIVLILYPERKRPVDNKKYYDKEVHREQMKKHRAHKKSVYDKYKGI